MPEWPQGNCCTDDLRCVSKSPASTRYYCAALPTPPAAMQADVVSPTLLRVNIMPGQTSGLGEPWLPCLEGAHHSALVLAIAAELLTILRTRCPLCAAATYKVIARDSRTGATFSAAWRGFATHSAAPPQGYSVSVREAAVTHGGRQTCGMLFRGPAIHHRASLPLMTMQITIDVPITSGCEGSEFAVSVRVLTAAGESEEDATATARSSIACRSAGGLLW